MNDKSEEYEQPAPRIAERPLELEPEEEVENEGEDDEPEKEEPEAKRAVFDIPDAAPGGLPPWVLVPDGFRFPRGKSLIFTRFKSSWTDTPWKGEPIIDPKTGKPYVEHRPDGSEKVILWRQCVCWQLSVGDKRLAIGRSMGDFQRAADEMTRQMIRIADGNRIDWTEGGYVEVFWNEIGERCRGLLNRIFNRLHVLDVESTADFLQNCIEVRSSNS